jgi:thiamine-phosphate pyrophosphorylase
VPRLILVTDRRLMGDDLPAAIARALRGAPAGTTWVQLREKDLGGRELCALASAVREACHAAGARLLVNDRVDVALAAGADGVHLPEQGLPVAVARRLLPAGALVTVAAHRPDAIPRGADAVLLAPIWEVPGKGAPLGVTGLQTARPEVEGALVALGGVTADRAAAARAAGADGVAAIRAVWSADDPAAAVRAILGLA